jgi:Sec-independent protein translocase protein TatA
MVPLRKLNDGLEGLRNERYSNLRKVRRRDYQDSGGAQRQFQELVEEFETEEGRKDANREKGKENDKVDIDQAKDAKERKNDSQDAESVNRKASCRVKNHTPDDGPVGGKLDINV